MINEHVILVEHHVQSNKVEHHVNIIEHPHNSIYTNNL